MTKRTLSEFLASLGSTADEVADSLRKGGVKGVKGHKTQCPILNALYNRRDVEVWSGLKIVNGHKVGDHWSYFATFEDCQIMDPTLPQPVMDFIGEFDQGKYPDLETEKVDVITTRVW